MESARWPEVEGAEETVGEEVGTEGFPEGSVVSEATARDWRACKSSVEITLSRDLPGLRWDALRTSTLKCAPCKRARTVMEPRECAEAACETRCRCQR